MLDILLSVPFRIAVIVIATVLLLASRRGGFKKLKERGKAKKKQQAEQQKVEERKAARRQAIEQAKERKRHTSQVLQLNVEGLQQKSASAAGMTFWFLEGGHPGRGPNVLLLHGFAGDKEDWNHFAGHLLRQGYRVIAPDLPGFGQNAKNPEATYDATSQTKRVRALVHKLGAQPCHIVGSSVGGTVAATWAYGAPAEVLSLTLIEPFGVRAPQESELDQWLAEKRHPLLIASPAAYDNLLSFLYVRAPEMPEAVKKIRAEHAARHRDFYLKMWNQIRGGDRAFFLDQFLGEIKTRTLVLQGEKSRIVHPTTAEIISRRIDGAQAVTIPDCGHLPAVEQPELTAQHVLKFLAASAEPAEN